MKKLGFGMMRMPLTDPNNEASVDIEQVKEMVDLFMDNGFTYFDTAIMYNGCKSQAVFKEAVADRYPRESYQVATKLHSDFFKTLEDRDRVFNEQMDQMGVSYFDYYLIHGINGLNEKKYENLDCFSWLADKQKQGLVKHIGFSFHDTAELLEEILNRHPEMEFVQLQLNYLDWESEWIQSRACYEVCVKHKKPVIVMEPVKGGTLANVPEEAERLLKAAEPDLSVSSWAMRFAASLDNVMMVLSGMSNVEQMQDNISSMKEFRPLNEGELELTRRVAEIINDQIAVPCTGCGYCLEGCPMNIPIPRYFSMYNEDMREDLEQKGWTANMTNYSKLIETFGKAGDCIACGQCENICPQHLKIIDLIKTVSEHYDPKPEVNE